MLQKTDPIVARASAAGRGGIGIVRISGSKNDIDEIVRKIFSGKKLQNRYAHLMHLNDAEGMLIDQVIAIYFQTPHSYTGETVLELQSHGGQIVVGRVIGRIMELGASVGIRLARPGEFTERAFLNGRMDLAQAEAVADLIDAGSVSASRAAARSLQGAFSEKISKLNENLLSLRTYVEATLDFPEEEIDFIAQGKIRENTEAILQELSIIEKQANRGKKLRDGLNVVLVGEPNVGKSSLINALAGQEVSIVTDVAGTTRDKIECEVLLDGLLVKLTDTAGLRETEDIVESAGVERAKKAVKNADVVLLLKDATGNDEQKSKISTFLLGYLREDVKQIEIFNKIDLCPDRKKKNPDEIFISARTGSGLDELIEKLKSLVGKESEEGDFIARTRHLECLSRARRSLEIAKTNLETTNLELAAEEMRLAGTALGEIVGQSMSEDILDRIFKTFCIGK